jgi:hypothetical protein
MNSVGFLVSNPIRSRETGFHPDENDPSSGKNTTSTKSRFNGIATISTDTHFTS